MRNAFLTLGIVMVIMLSPQRACGDFCLVLSLKLNFLLYFPKVIKIAKV
jgi:hypothetical protein